MKSQTVADNRKRLTAGLPAPADTRANATSNELALPAHATIHYSSEDPTFPDGRRQSRNLSLPVRGADMNVTSQSHCRARLLIAAGLTGTLYLGGCASTPLAPAVSPQAMQSLQAAKSLQGAEHAVSSAERAEAGRYAPRELAEARAKLASAYGAVSEQKMVAVEQLAEQSRVEADLAIAKTGNVKANAVIEEVKRGTVTATKDMRRYSGEKK